jgi:hypothetical protein
LEHDDEEPNGDLDDDDELAGNIGGLVDYVCDSVAVK